MTFHDLLMQNYIASWDKQVTFAAWLKERGNPNWGFDMGDGQLTFGTILALDCQLLGTESTSSQTWLWAWANKQSNIPPALLKAAEELRAYGEQQHIHELMDTQLALDETIHGHHICVVASALLDADFYYRGPYDGGALFLLVKDERCPTRVVNTPEHIVNVITGFAASVQTDNLRLLITHYFQGLGLTISQVDEVLTGKFADGSWVDVIFDNLGRLGQVKGNIKPRG